MKKVIALLVLLFSCALVGNLEAQFPATRTLVWDAPIVDATHGDAAYYNVTINGANTNVVAPTTELKFSITQVGPLNMVVLACNEWGCSPPAQLIMQVSVPGNSRNLRIR